MQFVSQFLYCCCRILILSEITFGILVFGVVVTRSLMVIWHLTKGIRKILSKRYGYGFSFDFYDLLLILLCTFVQLYMLRAQQVNIITN